MGKKLTRGKSYTAVAPCNSTFWVFGLFHKKIYNRQPFTCTFMCYLGLKSFWPNPTAFNTGGVAPFYRVVKKWADGWWPPSWKTTCFHYIEGHWQDPWHDLHRLMNSINTIWRLAQPDGAADLTQHVKRSFCPFLNSEGSLQQFITIDQTWVHHHLSVLLCYWRVHCWLQFGHKLRFNFEQQIVQHSVQQGLQGSTQFNLTFFKKRKEGRKSEAYNRQRSVHPQFTLEQQKKIR